MKKLFIPHKRFAAGIVAAALVAQVLLCPSAFAAAPAIYFDTSVRTVAIGEEFAVGIFIDTDQPVNAYAVDLTYPSTLFELVSFDDSRSIIDVWPRAPLVHESGKIELKGGSLQSFKGERGELITVRLKARGPGAAEFVFLDPALYLANGKGTKVIPTTRSLTLTIENSVAPLASPNGPAGSGGVSADTTAPETLQVALIEDPINPDQKLLSFQAKDADSGIQSIFYETRTWFFWRGEESVRSNPVALLSDAWSARVTAYDNAGNMTSRTVYDWGAFMRGPLVIYAIFLAIIARFFHKTRFRKRTII